MVHDDNASSGTIRLLNIIKRLKVEYRKLETISDKAEITHQEHEIINLVKLLVEHPLSDTTTDQSLATGQVNSKQVASNETFGALPEQTPREINIERKEFESDFANIRKPSALQQVEQSHEQNTINKSTKTNSKPRKQRSLSKSFRMSSSSSSSSNSDWSDSSSDDAWNFRQQRTLIRKKTSIHANTDTTASKPLKHIDKRLSETKLKHLTPEHRKSSINTGAKSPIRRSIIPTETLVFGGSKDELRRWSRSTSRNSLRPRVPSDMEVNLARNLSFSRKRSTLTSKVDEKLVRPVQERKQLRKLERTVPRTNSASVPRYQQATRASLANRATAVRERVNSLNKVPHERISKPLSFKDSVAKKASPKRKPLNRIYLSDSSASTISGGLSSSDDDDELFAWTRR